MMTYSIWHQANEYRRMPFQTQNVIVFSYQVATAAGVSELRIRVLAVEK